MFYVLPVEVAAMKPGTPARRSKLTTAFLLVLTISACSDQSVDAPKSQRIRAASFAAQIAGAPRGIESVFLEMEKSIPGFGGFTTDASGDIQVVVTDPSSTDAAQAAVRAWFAAKTDRFQRLPNAKVNVRLGQYAFSKLVEWQGAVIQGSTASDDIRLIDADELKNRVTVYVGTDDAAARMSAFAQRVGVPFEALSVEVRDLRVTPTTDVHTSIIRPTVAGFHVQYKYHTSPDSLEGCTLGWNVKVSGVRMFLLPSHCNRNHVGVTGMQWEQPTIGSPIGNTTINKAWQVLGCPSGSSFCRYTDASLVAYMSGTQSDSSVAETSTVGSGSSAGNTTVGTYYRAYAQMSGIKGVGDTVWKTGSISGTTKGPIVLTCAATGPDTEFHQFVWCSNVVQANDLNGDSGAPVYWYSYILNPNLVVPEGMAWASAANVSIGGGPYFLYNDWSSIEFDLGVTMTPFGW
jgi:hypothetical protein